MILRSCGRPFKTVLSPLWNTKILKLTIHRQPLHLQPHLPEASLRSRRSPPPYSLKNLSPLLTYRFRTYHWTSACRAVTDYTYLTRQPRATNFGRGTPCSVAHTFSKSKNAYSRKGGVAWRCITDGRPGRGADERRSVSGWVVTRWGHDDRLGRRSLYLELQGGAQHNRRLRFHTVDCKLDWRPLISGLTYDIHSGLSYSIAAMPEQMYAVGTGNLTLASVYYSQTSNSKNIKTAVNGLTHSG